MVGDGEETTTEAVERWQLLAQFVRNHEHELETSWLPLVKQRPAVSGVPDATLLACISPLLRWFAEQVRPPTSASMELLTDELARARPAEGINDVEIVAYLSILRDCLLRAWGRAGPPEQSLAVTFLVHRVIDACVLATIERALKTERRALDAVESVSLASFESSTLEELLQRLLETFRQATFAVDGALIALVEDDHLRPYASIGIDLTGEATVRAGEGFLGRIAAEKRSLSVRDVGADPLILHPGMKASGMRAAYGVPLLEAGSVVGVAAISSRTVWEFSQADRAIFDVMARRAAMAISYSRLREC